MLLSSTANAYTDIVHLPNEIDVDIGYIMDQYINNSASSKANDDNNDPLSIFIQYRLRYYIINHLLSPLLLSTRAITKVGPGDYTEPITSGHAIITMTTSIKKVTLVSIIKYPNSY
jgi:hypothetical protein